MKKNFLAMFMMILLCFSLCAYGNTAFAESVDKNEQSAVTSEVADGYEALGGAWAVGGIYYNKKLIDIHDNAQLEDLYDSVFLFFEEDGTFVYYNLYHSCGDYVRYEQENQNDDAFLLKTKRVFRIYAMENGELVEKESTSGSKTSYLVTFVHGDKDTITLCKYDAITGKARADDEPLVFVRDGESSDYISEQKIPIATNPAPNTASPKTATSSERNALEQAKLYLEIMPFSYEGLVEQLKYEGYSTSEAEYGAKNCGADWMEQAAKRAELYLELMPFSKSDLKDQLIYDGFTSSEAEYGVNKAY